MWQIGNAVPPRLAECIGIETFPSEEKPMSGYEKVETSPLEKNDVCL